MSAIEIITGSVTTRGNGSLNISAFHRPSAKGHEQPLFLAEKDEKAGVKSLGAPDIIQSGASRTGLKWSKKRYDVTDGGFIKFVFRRSAKTGGAFASNQTNLMIRARGVGPLMRIRIDLPADEHSRVSAGYIEGRFDVLTIEQVEGLGLHKNQQGASELHVYPEDDDDYPPYLNVTEIEKAITPLDNVKATVVKEATAGTTGKVMLKQRRGRNIRLRTS